MVKTPAGSQDQAAPKALNDGNQLVMPIRWKGSRPVAAEEARRDPFDEGDETLVVEEGKVRGILQELATRSSEGPRIRKEVSARHLCSWSMFLPGFISRTFFLLGVYLISSDC